jgi:hypothetical protein
MDAARDTVLLSIVPLVIEEIDPMPAVVATRGGVEMEAGHQTVEPLPRSDIADCLVFWVEVEPSGAPTIAVSAITEFTAGQVHGKVLMAALIRRGDFLRR